MKRIFLLIATNFAIMIMLSIIIHLFGLNKWITANGLNYGSLLLFCAVFGFGGAFISLLISKPMAKFSVGAKVISGTEGAQEAWIVQTVHNLATKAAIGIPEVALYDGEPNAFATGASKNNALVAVSTGLLQSMDKKQVEAVLAHEVAHIANSDMVTLTLIQGVVNTFVMFAARIVGFFVDRFLSSSEDSENHSPGIGYSITVIILDIIFGLLASILVAAFSRQREFRADSGAAQLMGDPKPMISALEALMNSKSSNSLPSNMQAFGISGSMAKFGALFSTHPPLEVRIEALKQLRK